MYWARAKAYLFIWCITYPSWCVSLYFLGSKANPTTILLLANIIFGIGTMTGISLAKGRRPDFYGLAVGGLFVPIQPLFVLYFLLLK